MTEQAEAGNVSDRVYSLTHKLKRLGGPAIQLYHGLESRIKVADFHFVEFVRGRNQTCAERFSQDKIIAGLRTTLGQNLIRVYHTGDSKTVFWLFIGNRVATANCRACLSDGICTTAQYFAEYSRFQVVRPCYQVNSHQYLATHSIYVAHGVSRSNYAKSIRIIDYRRGETNDSENPVLFIPPLNNRILNILRLCHHSHLTCS